MTPLAFLRKQGGYYDLCEITHSTGGTPRSIRQRLAGLEAACAVESRIYAQPTIVYQRGGGANPWKVVGTKPRRQWRAVA